MRIKYHIKFDENWLTPLPEPHIIFRMLRFAHKTAPTILFKLFIDIKKTGKSINIAEKNVFR